MEALTEKEKRMLDYITAVIEENGYSPSVRDIRSALGIKSTATVHGYLERLEKKGYIRKESGKSRTLTVDGTSPTTRKVPIIGKITAGLPILAVENFEGYVDFTKTKYKSDELFALKVSGTSMIKAGIFDGDIVIVCNRRYAENGDIIVALIDDTATVKTYYKENGHFRLQPENSAMEPIITKDLTVLGKVVASIRYY